MHVPFEERSLMSIRCLVCALTLCVFCFPTPALPVDVNVSSVGDWDILDMTGDGEVMTAEDVTAPPGFGPTVLEVSGDHMLGLAKGTEVGDGTIVLLYRELSPADRDADGLLVFRAQYGQDVSEEHNTKQVNPHIWLEQDNDSGLHFRAKYNAEVEDSFAMRSGFGLVTDPWNETNWIWQKVRLEGNRFQARFWPAHVPEPQEWHLDMTLDWPAAGRVGFRIGSGHVHIAHFATAEGDIPIAAPTFHLFPGRGRFLQSNRIPLTLYANASVRPGAVLTIDVEGGSIAEVPLSLPETEEAWKKELILSTSPGGIEGAIPVPANAPEGTWHAAVKDAEGQILAECAFVVAPAREQEQRLVALTVALAQLDAALEGAQLPPEQSAEARIQLDAARGLLANIPERLQEGELKAANRGLGFALEALAELAYFWPDGWAMSGLAEAAASEKALFSPGDEKVIDVYPGGYGITITAAELDTCSFTMGGTGLLRFRARADYGMPDRDFEFHVRLSSPLGHRTVSAAIVKPSVPTSAWEPGTEYKLETTLGIVTEQPKTLPAQPLVLDEYHRLLVSCVDPATGAKLVLPGRPGVHPNRPGSEWFLGEAFVSTAPLAVMSFCPLLPQSAEPGKRKDKVVVRHKGDGALSCAGVFTARYRDTGEVVFQSHRPMAFNGPGGRELSFDWTPPASATYELHFEAVAPGKTFTEARGELTVCRPDPGHFTVRNGLQVKQAADGTYRTTLEIAPASALEAPAQVQVFADGRLLAEETRDTYPIALDVEPWFGYYDIVLRTGDWEQRERIIATVVEVKDGQFCMNGEPFLVKGVNVHSLASNSPEHTRAMMRIMKERGFNALRGDHPPHWQVDMAYDMNMAWTVLAPFSCTHTKYIAERQGGTLMPTARALSKAFVNRYADSAGVLMWNSANEIVGETTDFLLGIQPVYPHLDPNRRPVHYANLFGQNRWQGQDAMGVNYYFGLKETAIGRQPLVRKSLEIGRAHSVPVMYNEFNSWWGAVPTSGVDAMYDMFDWGVNEGMCGGFFYMKQNSFRHPGIFDNGLNTHRIMDEAFIDVFADAKIQLKKAKNGTATLEIGNKRNFTLRQFTLTVRRGNEEKAVDVPDIAPNEAATLDIEFEQPALGNKMPLEGTMQFTTHYGMNCTVPFQVL